MNKEDIIKIAADFTETHASNRIAKEIALIEDIAGIKIFENPIFVFGPANDENFLYLKQPAVVGEHFILPREWMPEAKSVVSFFLPFTETVRKSNAQDMLQPSGEWLHGRFEGQEFQNNLTRFLQAEITKAGYKTMVPFLDERYVRIGERFTSNWSERHVAFTLGLGTFGLSKGLITKKGVAGRFSSFLTELEFEPSAKDYSEPYEYCSMCGACAAHCPVNAITIENGKNHVICGAFLDITREKYKPRHGCGKCQVDVPCEKGLPE